MTLHCNTCFEDFIEVYESINHQLWYQYGLKQVTKEELRYQRFYQAFNHFGYDNPELSHSWAEDYLKISPYKTHLIDGAVEVLEYLRKNYQLHIITNGFKEVQQIKMEVSTLKPYFNHVIISEDHGVSKPDVAIFRLAEKLTGASAHECLMIGDNYDTDIAGALNAEWKTIHFSSEKREVDHENYFWVRDLRGLKTFLPLKV